jgi:putative flippase GtrA
MPDEARAASADPTRAALLGKVKRNALGRQVAWYLVVGAAQLIVEWLCFVALTAWGMPVAPANVVARVAAALLGFTMNGMVTFKSRLHGALLLRFVVTWIPLTGANTLLVTVAERLGGLQVAWLLKPLVDGLTAVVSFLIARHWIFRAGGQFVEDVAGRAVATAPE